MTALQTAAVIVASVAATIGFVWFESKRLVDRHFNDSRRIR